MVATLDEQTQYVDSAGKPLVGGFITIGDQNANPASNKQDIFSDRALTIGLANPQTLDSLGRAANKIWVGGPFSLLIEDSNNVQIYQELDNGETAASGITRLDNVTGANIISATAVTTITAYTDLEQYTFRTVGLNTTAITLNIDNVGAKSVVKNQNQAILPGEFENDQNIIVAFNSDDDVFEWVNHNNKVIDFYEGIPVVSAATIDIWSQSGNTIHITGNTGPITSFGTAPNVGAVRWVIFDSTPTLTDSANLNLPGGVNFTATAGDFVRVYADTTTQFDVQIFKADGTAIVPVIPINLGTSVVTTSGTSIDFTGIPSDTKRVTINLVGVSTNGTDAYLIQLGDAGGVEISGYGGAGSRNSTVTQFTAGFGIPDNETVSLVHGTIVLTLENANAFTWVAYGVLSQSGSPVVYNTSGSKSLSAELDRIRLTTSGGSNTFDAGSMNITFE